MANEPLSRMTPILHSAKLLHSIMRGIERRFGLLTGVREASRTLTVFSLGDVQVVSGFEVLCLSAGLNFVIEQVCPPPAL